MHWEKALQILKEGNQRFLDQEMVQQNYSKDFLTDLSKEQHPHSVILTCSDSRVSPDIIFDQKLGDLFIIRNAGNIVDDVVVGSIEYATEHLHCPLVVILGHTYCGAVTAAAKREIESGHIQVLIERIAPHMEYDKTVNQLCTVNAISAAKNLRSALKFDRVDVKVIAAIYDLETGEIHWDIEL